MSVQVAERVAVIVEGSTGWLSPTAYVPLISALVALGGVWLGNFLAGRNDLKRTRREHMFGVIRDAYVDLEGARRELAISAQKFSYLSSIDDWRERGDAHLQAHRAASRKFRNAYDAVNLLGSKEVRKAGEDLAITCVALQRHINDIRTDLAEIEEVPTPATKKPAEIHGSGVPDNPYLPSCGDDMESSIDTLRRVLIDHFGTHSDTLLAAMRDELHG